MKQITLDDLMPYRDYMNERELERYADYILRDKPLNPFTEYELRNLRLKKCAALRRMSTPLLHCIQDPF